MLNRLTSGYKVQRVPALQPKFAEQTSCNRRTLYANCREKQGEKMNLEESEVQINGVTYVPKYAVSELQRASGTPFTCRVCGHDKVEVVEHCAECGVPL